MAHDTFLSTLAMIPFEGTLTESEAKYLRDTAGGIGQAAVWVELGVWCGRGYWSAANGLWPGSHLIGVDRFEGLMPAEEGGEDVPTCSGEFQWAIASAVFAEIGRVKPLVQCYLRLGDSADAGVCEDASVDVVVVDADHGYEAVQRDIEAWRPKVKAGGRMLFHDYCVTNPGVIRATNEAFGWTKVRRIPDTRFGEVTL